MQLDQCKFGSHFSIISNWKFLLPLALLVLQFVRSSSENIRMLCCPPCCVLSLLFLIWIHLSLTCLLGETKSGSNSILRRVILIANHPYGVFRARSKYIGAHLPLQTLLSDESLDFFAEERMSQKGEQSGTGRYGEGTEEGTDRAFHLQIFFKGSFPSSVFFPDEHGMWIQTDLR